MNLSIDQKYEKLKDILREMGEVVIAYSGGVDSTFLLKVAKDVLKDKVLGIIATSPTYPSREYEDALKIASEIGVKIKIINTKEMDNPKFIGNPVDRCYFCKTELFEKIKNIAEKENFRNFADGSNADDLGDYRPGMKALKEKNIRSPLMEAGLTKNEIRQLSKMLNLPTWDKPALACLSSRFPYGEKIELKKLRMVDEVENFLHDIGFKNIRARHFDKTVKIEVSSEEIDKFFDHSLRERIVKKVKEIGYTYVTIDLEGYRQGSMNEVLGNK
jgi:uncharacterized protein